MVLHTPKINLPYVEPTDTPVSYPTTSQELATTLDGKIPFAIAAGNVTMPSQPAANSGVSATVTFPVGRFTQPPMIAVTASSNGYGAGSSANTSTTATSARYYNPTGTTPTASLCYWIAVQMLSGAGPGLASRELPQDNYTATCDTPLCGNRGEVIPVYWDTADGPAPYVVCGVCNRPIEDVVPV